ncbi:MAG: hypothetical protein IPJ41_15245 [Phycisphaerales bacterium]|nr:hypothetical protein [Phycisphaerales bacterium]
MSRPHRMLPLVLAHVALLASVERGLAQPAPATAGYTGLFFHSFTGSVEGSEWATWADRPGEGRYEFSDLSAQGHYAGTIDEGGVILFDNGNGTGQFLSDDEADIHFTLGGGLTFESHIRRAPYTDAAFPVFLDSSVAGDASLAGAWGAHVLDVDPATGATLDQHDATWNVDIVGSTVRLTRPDGEFVQGVWASESQAAFRVISPPPRVQRYRTFVGSETSLDLDTVGELRVLGPEFMTLTACFQTRDPLGEQIQTMQYVELSRVPGPGVAGPFVVGAMGLGLRRERRGSGRRESPARPATRRPAAIGLAAVALCTAAHAGPVLDDFESYEVGGLPGAPWEDIADSILHPTLPAPTGQIITTLGRDGAATQAYQIFQERGTSQGIITSILPSVRPRVGADLRVDAHPSPRRYGNWTSARVSSRMWAPRTSTETLRRSSTSTTSGGTSSARRTQTRTSSTSGWTRPRCSRARGTTWIWPWTRPPAPSPSRSLTTPASRSTAPSCSRTGIRASVGTTGSRRSTVSTQGRPSIQAGSPSTICATCPGHHHWG